MKHEHRIFANEYLIEFNGTKSYRVAYPDCNSDESAAVNASRLLRNAKINAYIEQRMKEREMRTEITQDKVLYELAKIGFADIGDFLEYKTVSTVTDVLDDEGKPIVGYKQIVNLIDSEIVDTGVIQEVSLSNDGSFKFKLYDKQKALIDIGKHIGMFVDRKEITGGLGVTIVDDVPLGEVDD